MSGSSEADSLLIERIRKGEPDASRDLISRYEGRLLAFVESRLKQRGASEDIVQEAFIGFLNSLPNYDGKRPLESYLFSICAYKLTDHLRREGRRPAVPLSTGSESGSQWQLAGRLAQMRVRRGARLLAQSSRRLACLPDRRADAARQQRRRAAHEASGGGPQELAVFGEPGSGSTDYHALRPDVWKQTHATAVRTYRSDERRDAADHRRFRRARRRLLEQARRKNA